MQKWHRSLNARFLKCFLDIEGGLPVQTSQKGGLYGLAVLSFIFFFVYLHRVSMAVLTPDLMHDFSTTATELGILSSMYFYAYAIMQIPSGLLIDSIGPRKTVSFFTALTGVGALLFGLSQTLLMASVARLIIGIGVSVIFVATVKILARWFRPNEVSSYFGIFMLVGNLGAIGAAAPLAFMTFKLGWRFTFGILAIIAAIQTGFAWKLIQDAPEKETEPLQTRNHIIQQNRTNRNAGHPQIRQWVQFKTIIKHRLITKIAAMVFVTYGTLIAFQGLWGVPFLMQVYHLTKGEASQFITLIAVGYCIGAPFFGYLSDKVFRTRKPIICAGVLLYTLMWFFLAFKTIIMSKALLFTLCFGLGFFHGTLPISIAMIKEDVDEENVGLAVGYMNIYPMVGIAIFQPLIGLILDSVSLTNSFGSDNSLIALGYTHAFQFCLFCLILASIVSLTLRETYIKPKGPSMGINDN